MSRLIRIWRLLNLPCAGVTRLSSESLDRDLSRLERFAQQSHILYCRACRRYSRQLKLVRCAMRQLATCLETDQPLPGPGLPDDARERIKRRSKRSEYSRDRSFTIFCPESSRRSTHLRSPDSSRTFGRSRPRTVGAGDRIVPPRLFRGRCT